MKPLYKDLLYAIISPFFSSVSTVFKSGAAKILSPVVVVGVGGLIGSIILFLVSVLKKDKINFKKIKQHWRALGILIILRTILGELFLTFGLSLTTSIKAIFLTKIEPYFVLLIGVIFLNERFEKRHIALLLIHLTGAIILSTGGNIMFASKAQIGDLFIIIAMALFASSYIYGKRLANSLGSTVSNAISMAIGSVIVLPFMVFLMPKIDFTSQFKGWIYLLVYVILFNVISLSLWFASLKSVRGWIVSALRYIGPVLGAPVAFLLFGETLSTTQVLGAVIILITSFLIAREHLKKVEKSARSA
ncbi:MAG: hypothetical protein UT56_C0002G0047 [Candidatus Levybacteria bacterium GW2011_GWB1_39_7]|nr:MAG: hypothetical protein UT20_C0019G0004 [Candidatus Levybacteria bacterium GW2011_GWA1_39_11]KKR25233.1 MAG: hypothetical protein UT56_C0002G0047 [Candidatus Levybacteria bacterium GW2011_GWB1_39_7]KKR27506.1 MAG: hypothetical protein UT57_C0003G0020 [Microgenomates group bacterium GW2011_GWC1_39_7]OGH45337.1 MAG: hypothetical protein A3H82_01780 [Candidatus Levybacteria bacterium RIFCSPLOWO2_02_FULL_39_26]OGH48408.1 MAG: hypothetical protein A3G66_00325 [Candidatus Levybacteria bacterium 